MWYKEKDILTKEMNYFIDNLPREFQVEDFYKHLKDSGTMDNIIEKSKKYRENLETENDKYRIFEHLKNKKGIYKLTFFNGMIYIGESSNLSERLATHYKILSKNYQYNKDPFKYSFDSNGQFVCVGKSELPKDENIILDNKFFKYEILEYVNDDINDENILATILIYKEQTYIKEHFGSKYLINKQLTFDCCKNIFHWCTLFQKNLDKLGSSKSVSYFLCQKFEELNYNVNDFKNIEYSQDSCDNYYYTIYQNLIKNFYRNNIYKLKEYINDKFYSQKFYLDILEIPDNIRKNSVFRNRIERYCDVEWKGSQMKLLRVKENFDE